MSNNFKTFDIDPDETNEWLESLAAVVHHDGPERARFLLKRLIEQARRSGADVPFGFNTPYMNTIPVSQQPVFPGDEKIEKRIASFIRWNAVAMVLRAGKTAPELGGHIATFASSATLYEVGFNHFFRGSNKDDGDLIYIQGHSSPGIYARAFLEGRLSESQLNNFRQEVEKEGLSSYPHPWLMPDFWQFPTVSMGLGPLQAIYKARFLKYLHNRGLANTENRKVWVFCGDGEMDEPESLGAISLAAREKLDNLIFVINCNLQRLDGPVRGNGKVIQEFEGVFRGAGWKVLKVIWGRRWDTLLAKDEKGLLLKRMEECVDGEYQNFKARDGAYVREKFFGKYPELKAMVANMTDDEIWRLNRGGHDCQKVYAAYKNAVETKGQPIVILAKTIKGYGMGAAGEGLNITHQQKKMSIDDLKHFRDRFNIPITDNEISEAPFYRPDPKSQEARYLKERRESLGGYLPSRRAASSVQISVPKLENFDQLLKSTGDRHISTTMAFVRFLNMLMKDKNLGSRVVPIVPDESRTFGMEGMFRQYGIYSPIGQLYEPVDSAQVMFYKESSSGQILQEGINEPGAMCSWMAAGTTYSTANSPMIPFYIYYSMFGFQRVGDLAWAAGDMRAQGFLLGGTAGRTTLAGEGLQHQDGHSHVLASTVPNCKAYDPTFSYELVVILHHGLKEMYEEQKRVYYYITLMNENYEHPDMPEGVEEGIIKGMYLFKKADEHHKMRVNLLGSGTILNEVIAAAKILESEYQIGSNIWSVTSFNELRRDANDVERYNLRHPDKTLRKAYVTQCLEPYKNEPIIAATDYMRIYAEQIRPYIHAPYLVLGTDGYGRSDTRKALRHFFEVDTKHIVYTAIKAQADAGNISQESVLKARKKLGIDPDKPNPLTV